MAKEITLTCSECGATQTEPATSAKWRGWRVLLRDRDRPPLGYRCPGCHGAREAEGGA